MSQTKFYNFYENEAGEAQLDLFGEIGWSWWGDSKDFVTFEQELREYGNRPLNINIDSPGGNVFDGNAMANAIKKRTSKTTCTIYSLCASIATQIALACDEVKSFKNSLFMIHLASAGTYGNKEELKKIIDLLDKIDHNLADTYVDKTNIEKQEVLKMMSEETWLTASEALEKGFIDQVIDAGEVTAKAKIDLKNYTDKYKKIPEQLLNLKSDDSEDEMKIANQVQKEEKERERKKKEIEIALALI